MIAQLPCSVTMDDPLPDSDSGVESLPDSDDGCHGVPVQKPKARKRGQPEARQRRRPSSDAGRPDSDDGRPCCSVPALRRRRFATHSGTPWKDYMMRTTMDVVWPPSIYAPGGHAALYWEIFCPPRVASMLRSLGICRSFDLETDWDLSRSASQWSGLLFDLQARVKFTLLCPPCTHWTPLMASNWLRMSVEQRESKASDGIWFLLLSVA